MERGPGAGGRAHRAAAAPRAAAHAGEVCDLLHRTAHCCTNIVRDSPASPPVKFARAIITRRVYLAELALGEIENALLEDALQMVMPYGEQPDPKYATACRRYLARWIVEEAPSLEGIAATACHFVERGQPRLV